MTPQPQSPPAQTSDLLPGFDHAAFDSNAVFRALLDAMSRPGRIYDLPVAVSAPDGLNKAATATLLAMADMDTTIWLSPSCTTKAAGDHLKFHCGCPISTDVKQADFAIARISDDLSFVTDLAVGNAEYPDQSATLILMVDEISDRPSMTLKGPGIKDTHSLAIKGLPASFHAWRAENHHLFPCGVDVIFASETQIAALSRTTRIEVN
jgi:alpha-D-ribose 1-methylphosphonate 5-triphosphate synthase subunit PhnH